MEEMLRRNLKTVYKVALSHTGCVADAEDIMQNAAVAYLTKPPEFFSQEHEKRWFITVALNLCKSRWRSAFFRRTVPLGEWNGTAPAEQSDVQFALLSLPPQYRDVVYLHYYECYFVEQMSSMLNVSPSAVKKRLERARKKLKIMLGDGYDEL